MPLQMYEEAGDTVAQITTDGSTLKPFFNALRPLIDEAKLHFNGDGLHVTAIDATNVVLIDISLSATAFEEYTLYTDEFVTEVNIGQTRHLIRRARMNSDDTLTLKVAENQLYATVERGYDNTNVVTEDAIRTLDPDSIRQELELTNLNTHEVNCGFDAFRDGVTHVTELQDDARFSFDSGDLVVSTDTDTAETSVRFEGVVPEDEEAEIILSETYLTDIFDSLKKGKTDDVTVNIGNEVPIFIDFERERDGETIMHGTAVQAPRIQL